MISIRTPLLYSILVLFVLTGSLSLWAQKTVVHSVNKKQMALLKSIDQKYQAQHGVNLQFKKTVLLEILGTKKSSEGELWLNQGLLRLEIKKPEVSRVVVDKDFLWIESPSIEDSKPQVLRTSLNSKQAQSQALVHLLTQGGLLKHFRVTGVRTSPKELVYFLQPDQSSVEFKRAQINIDPKTQVISSLRYWDQMDNETIYEFTRSEFNKKLDQRLFVYRPPQGVEPQVF
jgi:chaperone LolA